jgi:hypothetical protein
LQQPRFCRFGGLAHLFFVTELGILVAQLKALLPKEIATIDSDRAERKGQEDDFKWVQTATSVRVQLSCRQGLARRGDDTGNTGRQKAGHTHPA